MRWPRFKGEEFAKRKGVWITNKMLFCCPFSRLVFA